MRERGRTRRPPPRPVPRDQHESAFGSILTELVGRLPGALAAALVDLHGETVDYAGTDPYAVRLAAAHWRIVLNDTGSQPSLAMPRWITVRATRASYAIHTLPEGYALVLVLSRGAGVPGPRRAIGACMRLLAAEAGWALGGAADWYPVDVASDARRRPQAILLEAGPRSLDVLGAVASGLAHRDRGWRVRTDNGVEATLVREPGGFWYVDEPLAAGFAPAAGGGAEESR